MAELGGLDWNTMAVERAGTFIRMVRSSKLWSQALNHLPRGKSVYAHAPDGMAFKTFYGLKRRLCPAHCSY